MVYHADHDQRWVVNSRKSGDQGYGALVQSYVQAKDIAGADAWIWFLLGLWRWICWFSHHGKQTTRLSNQGAGLECFAEVQLQSDTKQYLCLQHHDEALCTGGTGQGNALASKPRGFGDKNPMFWTFLDLNSQVSNVEDLFHRMEARLL